MILSGPRRAAPLLAVLLALAGCRAPGSARPTLRPPAARVAHAALAAARDPQVWVPAAGALLFGLTDLDDRVGGEVRGDPPVFGSSGAAGTASDALLAASGALAAATAILAPAGGPPGASPRGVLGPAAVEGGAVAAAGGVAWLLKEASDRERPDGSDHRSFPSGHAALAAAFGEMARRNARWGGFGPGRRRAVDAASTALEALTDWARVEAGAHHVSDVLAGTAIGAFTARVVHDAVLGPATGCVRVGGPPPGCAVGVSVTVDR